MLRSILSLCDPCLSPLHGTFRFTAQRQRLPSFKLAVSRVPRRLDQCTAIVIRSFTRST